MGAIKEVRVPAEIVVPIKLGDMHRVGDHLEVDISADVENARIEIEGESIGYAAPTV